MRRDDGEHCRLLHLGLLLPGAFGFSAAEHARRQPSWMERLQSRDAVHHHSIAMKNSLPELRAERGWTQGELASRLKVSRQTVNAIETERYEPSPSLAFTIAKLFEQSIEDIFRPSRR
jgi:putative transcriptional regulator